MGRTAGALSLILLTLLPLVSAVPIQGELEVGDRPTFPPETEVSLRAAGVVLRLPAPFTEATFEAGEARVWIFEQTYLKAGAAIIGLGVNERSWHAKNVTIQALGVHDGYMAIEPTGRTTARLKATEPVSPENRNDAWISGDGSRGANPNPASPFYYREFSGNALVLTAPGELTILGNASAKFLGARVAISSERNDTVWDTGRSSTAAHDVYRWAYVELMGARGVVSSPTAPFDLAAAYAQTVTWEGRASWETLSGSFVGPASVYAGRGPTEVVGSFEAALYPVADGADALRLSGLRGDLWSTTLRAEPVPGPHGDSPPWGFLVLGLVAAVAAGGGAWLLRRGGGPRREPWASLPAASGVPGASAQRAGSLEVVAVPAAERAEEYSEEENHAWCLAWAHVLEEENEWHLALQCVVRARAYESAPEYDSLFWEASLRDRLGDLPAAFEAYCAAVPLAERGDVEAAYAAALVAGTLGWNEDALLYLRLALMGDPLCRDDVVSLAKDNEDPFARLRATAEFRVLMKESLAWYRSASSEEDE